MVASIFAHELIDKAQLAASARRSNYKNIAWRWIDRGNNEAGSISMVIRVFDRRWAAGLTQEARTALRSEAALKAPGDQ